MPADVPIKAVSIVEPAEAATRTNWKSDIRNASPRPPQRQKAQQNVHAGVAGAANEHIGEPATRNRHQLLLQHLQQQHEPDAEEVGILLAGPTFSDRVVRYLILMVYLCGMCSLGFFLSIYYIFFWDSRMPAVYKEAHSKKVASALLIKS